VDAVRLAELRDAALSVDEVVAAVDEAGAGGTAVFVGRVRDSDGGRAVASLAYSAHPSAAEVLRASTPAGGSSTTSSTRCPSGSTSGSSTGPTSGSQRAAERAAGPANQG